MKDLDEKLRKADEILQKQSKNREHLLVLQRAQVEIPSIWKTGEVTQTALARTYGISQATVKRIIQGAGLEVKRVRVLNEEERAEITSLLQQDANVDQLAAAYHVSRNTIRRVGQETGVIFKGTRKPRRSDAEYELIREFDNEARRRFGGAGLYNLGMGLKQWEHRRAIAASAVADAEPDPGVDGGPILAPEEAYPDIPPPVQQWTPNEAFNEGSPEPAHTEADPTPGYTVDASPETIERNQEPDPEPEPAETEPAATPDPFRNF